MSIAMRHAETHPVLVLVAWLLMVPSHEGFDWEASVRFDAKAPLSTWERKSSHETEEACEKELTTLQRMASLDAVHDSWWTLYRAARCVREDAAPPGKSN